MSRKMDRTQVVNTGPIVQTAGVAATINPMEVLAALSRHLRGDWGDCCPEDAKANDQALRNNDRILSVYRTRDGQKFWIITDAYHNSRDFAQTEAPTTVLLPSEY